ncbi:Small subunit (SSU) processome component [Allomyces arbusculus]|nr:Small subunit (SSU) processome component [Allomyces arbusculus]
MPPKNQTRGKARRAELATRAARDAAHEAAIKRGEARVLLTEDAGFLEPEHELERTYKVQQRDLAAEHLDWTNRAKVFDLDLPQLGPYTVDYTRNGRHLLIGGHKGHLAAFDWKLGKLQCEVQLREPIRDVCWLHNETLFAVAQKDCAYIYDNTGLEVHRMKKHKAPQRLTFLPYHFLLASIGDPGTLVYQDVSTGQIMAEHATKLGKCAAMTQNPWNAIIHCGHGNGTVTLWSPNSGAPLVKVLAHRGAVTSVAVNPTGHVMATGGLDGQVKLWDLRNAYAPLHAYFSRTPAADLSFSQRGLLAVAWGSHATVWKDAAGPDKAQSPYMTHHIPGAMPVTRVRFAPYEDVLGVGHAKGISSLVVPGAGEPNFDALEANPYATKKMRREAEVKQLLDKLPADTIAIDPNVIGALVSKKDDRALRVPGTKYHGTAPDQQKSRQGAASAMDVDGEPNAEDDGAEGEGDGDEAREKNRKKGRGSSMKKYLRKQKNVMDAKKKRILDQIDRERAERDRRRRGISAEEIASPLDRFKAKKR